MRRNSEAASRRVLFYVYALIIVGFAAPSIGMNAWGLLRLERPRYYINRLFLSGTLLLYDRPMFFESRKIELRLDAGKADETLDYNLQASFYQSYLERRLFRFATNETKCGVNQGAAFESLFCESGISSLKDKKIDSVTVRFTPHLKSGSERTFEHECRRER